MEEFKGVFMENDEMAFWQFSIWLALSQFDVSRFWLENRTQTFWFYKQRIVLHK